MATVTARSTSDLAASFAYEFFESVYDLNVEYGADTYAAAKEYAETGTFESFEKASASATQLKFKGEETNEEDGFTETSKEELTITGSGLDTSNAQQQWTGIRYADKDTWSGDGHSGQETSSGSMTLKLKPFDLAAGITITETKDSWSESGKDSDGKFSDSGSSAFKGTYTGGVDQSSGKFSSTIKINSMTEAYQWSHAGEGGSGSLSMSSTAGVTFTAASASGSFDKLSFSHKWMPPAGSTDTPRNDSYSASGANAELVGALQKLIWIEVEEDEEPVFSAEQLKAVEQAMFSGNDKISGSKSEDSLYGHAGNDAIDGGLASDRLVGGKGVDALTGGKGADTFVFAAGDSGTTLPTLDVVKDFKSADKDKIQLSGLAKLSYAEGTAAVKDFIAAKTAAEAQIAGGANAAFQFDKKGGYLFVDTDGDKAVDLAVSLVGLKTAAAFGDGDIALG